MELGIPEINSEERQKLTEIRDAIASIPDDDEAMWELFDDALGVRPETRAMLIELFTARSSARSHEEAANFVGAIATGIVIAERRQQNG